MQENILLVIFLPLIKAGEYFVGYVLPLLNAGEYFVRYCFAISECLRIFC